MRLVVGAVIYLLGAVFYGTVLFFLAAVGYLFIFFGRGPCELADCADLPDPPIYVAVIPFVCAIALFVPYAWIGIQYVARRIRANRLPK
jgi:hypothetical protein